MLKSVVSISLLFITLYGVLMFFFARVMAPKMMFQGVKIAKEKAISKVIPHQEVSIKTEDGITLSGVHIKKYSAKHTVLYFHGNGGALDSWIFEVDVFRDLPVNLLMIDYRGYGKSEGEPTEEGLYLDAEASFKYLLEHGVAKENIILFGRSLGSAVAIDLAKKKNLERMILVTPFHDFQSFANQRFWFLMPWMTNPFQFANCEKVQDFKGEAMIYTGSIDHLIPPKFGKKLQQCFPKKVGYEEIYLAGHNNISASPQYQKSVQQLIESWIH